MAILHQPHPINMKLKRVCRLVVLPDYQGIGLGTKFLNIIADYYHKQGFDFSIVTSTKNLINSLKSKSNWILVRYSASKNSEKAGLPHWREKTRNNCKTASFFYKGSDKNGK